MLKSIKALKFQKDINIIDIKDAPISKKFRGLPIVSGDIDEQTEKICPTGAIVQGPLKDNIDTKAGSIDLGKCIFCGKCEKVSSNIRFTNEYKIGTNRRAALVVPNNLTPVIVKQRIKSAFGHSLELLHLPLGSCGGCEFEMQSTLSSDYNIERYGINFTNTPHHADGIVITGPITKNTSEILFKTYDIISDPKVVILTGTCAISGGIFQNSQELDRSFFEKHRVDLFIPGCPPHPLTFISAVMDFLDIQ